MTTGWLGPVPIRWITAVSALLLFACAGLRHALYQSAAFDLVLFDQALYLISAGEPPIVSILGFHILGDHAAVIFYPLALLYWIFPTVHALFAVQALALAAGGVITWHLAVQAGVGARPALAVSLAYFLYPLVFNINLFDFHSEVIAVPGLLGAVLAARAGRTLPFTLLVALVLSCKAVLSLTVMMLGLWLILAERRRGLGAFALAAGLGWFLLATQWVVPAFSGQEHAALERYAYLGSTLSEIALNLVRDYDLALARIISLDSLEYLGLLFLPLIWGLSLKSLPPLIPILPQLMLNLLSEADAQRTLVHQYSVPVLPFLILAVIATLSADQARWRRPWLILICAAVGFLALAKPGYFWSRYLIELDTLAASREAVAQVTRQGGVFATSKIAPHLAHRRLIKQTLTGMSLDDVSQFDYVILNRRHPGDGADRAFIESLLGRLEGDTDFQKTYQRDEVFVFSRAAR